MGLPGQRAATRASDADRAIGVGILRSAWLEGRLTLAEFEQRVSLVLQARDAADLDRLLADLPQPEIAAPLLAGWWRRSLALALDHLLLAAGIAAIAGVGAATGHAVAAALAAALVAPLAAVGYFTLAHGSRSGRSVGERLCGIAVRADPHRAGVARRASYGQAFGRASMLYVFVALSAWGVGVLNFLWPLWDVKKQAWHDKVAGTIVVRAPATGFERRRWIRRWRGWRGGFRLRRRARR